MNRHALPLNSINTVVSRLDTDVFLIEGNVAGDGFRIDLTCPDAFAKLADRVRIVYRFRSTWADYEAESSRSVTRPGDQVTVDQLCVLSGGAAHFLTGLDPAFARLLAKDELLEATEEAEWRAEEARRQVRLTEVTTHVRENYPERLLEDSEWLRGGTRRVRENQGRTWLAQEFPDVAAEQKVVTALLNAVALAEDKREYEVMPRHITEFARNLNAHAAKLADRPEFQQATTKQTRCALARRYIAQTDALVPAGEFAEQLAAAAALA
jgi:hypothetical protein